MERHSALALATLLALAACGSGQQSQSSATATPPPGTGPVKISSGNAFSPLVQDLNKAKTVNSQVQQQGQATDQAIDSQSGAPAAATSQP